VKKLIFGIIATLVFLLIATPKVVNAQSCECHVVSHYGVGDRSCEVNASMNKCATNTTAWCPSNPNTCTSASCKCIGANTPTPTPPQASDCYYEGIAMFETACSNAGYAMCANTKKPTRVCCRTQGVCPAPTSTPTYKCVTGDPLHFTSCAVNFPGYPYACPGSLPRCCTSSAGCPTIPPPGGSATTTCGLITDSALQASCKNCMENGSGKVWTAIGCFPATIDGLFKQFFPFLLGIAGGIAFLLILFGALQMMTSAGNPEKLNAGKELVSAAITGLLLIIFSVFILRLIGVDLLGIPGFG